VAAADTCVMMVFIWAAERFKPRLFECGCRLEGTKLIELDRTEAFTHPRLRQKIRISLNGEERQAVESCTRRAMQSARKHSLVANSVKSEVTIEPRIEFVA